MPRKNIEQTNIERNNSDITGIITPRISEQEVVHPEQLENKLPLRNVSFNAWKQQRKDSSYSLVYVVPSFHLISLIGTLLTLSLLIQRESCSRSLYLNLIGAALIVVVHILSAFLVGVLIKYVCTTIKSCLLSASSYDTSAYPIDWSHFREVKDIQVQMMGIVGKNSSGISVNDDDTKFENPSFEQKKAFFASIVHDMRSPISGIVLSCEMLLDSIAEPKILELINGILVSAQLTLNLVNDVLDFNKLEAKKLDIERTEFNIRECMEQVAGILQPKAEEKGIEIILHIPHTIPMMAFSDPNRLTQLLLNLAGNAVKFTDTGHVLVKLEVNGDDCLVINVRDTGIGLSPTALSLLFQPYSQPHLRTSNRNYGGTGLGLCNAQQLAHLLGGNIGVSSQGLGKGSTFTLTLPSSISSCHIGTGCQLQSPNQSPTILIIDSILERSQALSETCIYLGCKTIQTDMSNNLLDRALCSVHICLIDSSLYNLEAVNVIKKRFSSIHLAVITNLRDAITTSEVDSTFTKPLRHQKLAKLLVGENLKCSPSPSTWSVTMKKIKTTDFLGKTVLVVDDLALNRKLISFKLEQFGMESFVASNGKEAVDMCKQAVHPFDLVIMDCIMPIMTGYEATQVLRNDYRYKSIPIVALTAMEDDFETCHRAGMNAYLTKPLNIEKLMNLIRKLLQEHDEALVGQPETPTSHRVFKDMKSESFRRVQMTV